MPVVNARPDIVTYDLTEQTAVDVAQQTDPMVAAQKLRDFAISYDAEGSTMIMVIGVADLFKGAATIPATVDKRKKCGIGIIDRTLDRLKEEVPPPTGHLAIVFTDIKGSTLPGCLPRCACTTAFSGGTCASVADTRSRL
ncbi:hypothetical protein FB451DRAFT_1274529, partial [Mycena latifolia]